jgi:N-acyl-L-homoserine lactone synthetase
VLTHVVTAANRGHYSEQLHQMFKQRSAFRAQSLAWSTVNIIESNEDHDEYDDEDAVYLLVLDEIGLLQASLRMRPSISKCLLLDHFPQLIAGDSKTLRSTRTWDASRYLVSPHLRGYDQIDAAEMLNLAALEFNHSRGVTQFLGLSTIEDMSRNRKSGWRTRILGLPRAIGGCDVFAFATEVSPNAISDVRSITGNFARCFVELPAMAAPNSNLNVSEFIDLLHEMAQAWEDQGERVGELVDASRDYVSGAKELDRRSLH